MFIAKVDEIVKNEHIDMLFVKDLFFSLFLADYDKPKILDISDARSLFFKRELKRPSSPINHVKDFLWYVAFRNYERRLLDKYGGVITVSPVDTAYLKKLNNKARIYTIPLGVDVEYFKPLNNVNEDFPSMTFIGTLTFSPNTDSVHYIYSDIFPLIKSHVPGIKFYIVGMNPPNDILQMSKNPDVVVTGYVDDIRPYIQRSSIILAPMRKGGGMKHKIFEAIAMEKTVVTNPMGAEALNRNMRDCIVVTEKPADIANAVITLLDRPEERMKLGKQGREILIEDYSTSQIARQYEKIFNTIVNGDITIS